MRVNGDAFFLFNVGLDCAALFLAARLVRVRARPARLLLAALLGGLYAVAAALWPVLFALPASLPAGLLLALCAFGRQGFAAFPGLLAGGLALSGLLSFGLRSAWPKGGILLACAAAVPLLGRLAARRGGASAERLTLRLSYRGRVCVLPAFRDSGNTLFDPVTGLPVVVLSAQSAAALFPFVLDPDDLSALPRGFRFIRVRSAAGERTLPCFHPDQAVLLCGRRAVRVDAVAAVSAFSEKRALLPEALFREASVHQKIPFQQEAM